MHRGCQLPLLGDLPWSTASVQHGLQAAAEHVPSGMAPVDLDLPEVAPAQAPRVVGLPVPALERLAGSLAKGKRSLPVLDSQG